MNEPLHEDDAFIEGVDFAVEREADRLQRLLAIAIARGDRATALILKGRIEAAS